MSAVELREEPWLCDGCTAAPPTTRWDLPAGLPLFVSEDKKTGKPTEIRSGGSFGLCDACGAELDRAPTTAIAAKRIAERMGEHAEALRRVPEGARRIAAAALVRFNLRLFPFLTNRRAWFDAPATSSSTRPRAN